MFGKLKFLVISFRCVFTVLVLSRASIEFRSYLQDKLLLPFSYVNQLLLLLLLLILVFNYAYDSTKRSIRVPMFSVSCHFKPIILLK